MPFPKGLQTGILIGQPNSTLLMSAPIRFRSSGESDLSHSRTGSPPASVRKKIAGTRLPSFSAESAFRLEEGSSLSLTWVLYHIWYIPQKTRLDPKSKSPPCPCKKRRGKGGALASVALHARPGFAQLDGPFDCAQGRLGGAIQHGSFY